MLARLAPDDELHLGSIAAPSVIGGLGWTLAKDKGNPLQSSG
jgi:hypothetical protein